MRRDKVGFVFQAFSLVPTLSAIENITLPMDIAGRKADQAWLEQVIADLGLAAFETVTAQQFSSNPAGTTTSR